jgi:hypothetical protein
LALSALGGFEGTHALSGREVQSELARSVRINGPAPVGPLRQANDAEGQDPGHFVEVLSGG